MLSVVVPIYNEEENISAFHSAIRSVMEGMEEHWEVVYVNDGSRDKSLSLLLDIQKHDPCVTVVEFSRNFGHQAALTAGLLPGSAGSSAEHGQSVERWRESSYRRALQPRGNRPSRKALSFVLQGDGLDLGFPHSSECGDLRLA